MRTHAPDRRCQIHPCSVGGSAEEHPPIPLPRFHAATLPAWALITPLHHTCHFPRGAMGGINRPCRQARGQLTENERGEAGPGVASGEPSVGATHATVGIAIGTSVPDGGIDHGHVRGLPPPPGRGYSRGRGHDLLRAHDRDREHINTACALRHADQGIPSRAI